MDVPFCFDVMFVFVIPKKPWNAKIGDYQPSVQTIQNNVESILTTSASLLAQQKHVETTEFMLHLCAPRKREHLPQETRLFEDKID